MLTFTIHCGGHSGITEHMKTRVKSSEKVSGSISKISGYFKENSENDDLMHAAIEDVYAYHSVKPNFDNCLFF